MAKKTLSGNRQLKTEGTAVKELAERKLATQVLVQVLNTKVRCVWGKGLPDPSPNYATKENTGETNRKESKLLKLHNKLTA